MLGLVVVVDGVALATAILTVLAGDGLLVRVNHVMDLQVLRGLEALVTLGPRAHVRPQITVGVHLVNKGQRSLLVCT